MTRKAPRIALIAAALCTFALPFALFGCGGSSTPTTSEDTPAQDAKADDTEQPETVDEGTVETDDEGTVETDDESTTEADPVDADQHAPVPEDETEDSYRAQWEAKACSFLTVYPVNYVRATSDEEPMYMSLEDWASNCLSYLDPDCELARSLQEDPESVATPLSFYDVAQVVDSTEVIASDESGVTVEVTEEATQQSWDYTTELVRTFRVTFGDNALITGVEELS